MRFRFQGAEHDGFDHPYNTTILNERAVEIPVVLDWLPGKGRGLEVGNVLSHYFPIPHRVVDLYEQADGVENLDLFDIEGSYDWIVSISTLEHVQWDQEPRDPAGAQRAVEHLYGLLGPGGRLMVTVPGGHHPHLDAFLAEGAGADRSATLVRSGPGWVQSAEPQFLPYGYSTKWAESVWIGEWTA